MSHWGIQVGQGLANSHGPAVFAVSSRVDFIVLRLERSEAEFGAVIGLGLLCKPPGFPQGIVQVKFAVRRISLRGSHVHPNSSGPRVVGGTPGFVSFLALADGEKE